MSIPDLEFQPNAANPSFAAKFKFGDGHLIIIVSPTQNCQIASIGPMDAVFLALKGQQVEVKIAKINRLIATCHKGIPTKQPKMLLFDVSEEHVKDANACFDRMIVSQLPGVDQNVVFLIDVRSIFAKGDR